MKYLYDVAAAQEVVEYARVQTMNFSPLSAPN